MDNQEAKLVLSAYRPGGEDATDPVFAEALEQARRDPELADWFAAQRRLDASMSKALQSCVPPADLRDRIVFNQNVVRISQPPAPERRVWSQPRFLFALAASIVLLLSIGLFYKSAEPALMTSRHFVENVVELNQSGQISLGRMGGGIGELRSWLAEQGSPSDFEIPPDLEAHGGIGCQTFTINGHQVSLVCFMLEKDRLVHFFVIDNEGIEHPPGLEPRFIRRNGHTAATWSAGGRTYVLTGKDIDEETLLRLI